ncbi:hypothetical protein V8E36_004781 [Tilletia maclaganii]
MSTSTAPEELPADAAAALMDIDGADLEDAGGFASIDPDASDEPTKILMILGLQEQLNARDIGLALHAHFNPSLEAARDPSAPRNWLSKVITVHALPKSDGETAVNTGKAFAICSDVDTAKRILDTFEEQYLEADVDAGFRLKLPAETAQRLAAAGSDDSVGETEQLLICYAAPTILLQCGPDDPRDASSTIAVQLDWAEARFSYRDVGFGVQCWDAAQDLNAAASSTNAQTPNGMSANSPHLSGTPSESAGKKRSRSAMIREELRSAQAPQPNDGAAFAAALQQAKLEFIKDQLSFGVPVLIPLDLQGPLLAMGARNLTPANISQIRTAEGGAMPPPVTPTGADAKKSGLSSNSRKTFAPASTPITPATQAPGSNQQTPSGSGAAGAKAPAASGGGSAHFLPARPSSQTIEASTKRNSQSGGRSKSGSGSAGSGTVAENGGVNAGTAAARAVAMLNLSPLPMKPVGGAGGGGDRKRSFSGEGPTRSPRDPIDMVYGPTAQRREDGASKSHADTKSRRDLSEGRSQGGQGSEAVSVEPSSKKSRGSLPQPPAALPTAAQPASEPRRSSRKSTGRGSIPAPAQAPPSLLPSNPLQEAESATRSSAAAPTTSKSAPVLPNSLEVPSGMRLPAPMEGHTRVIPPGSDEVPRNYDFCNQDRMLCLLCLRQFKSALTLRKHVAESALHKSNLDKPDARQAGAVQLINSFRPKGGSAASGNGGASTMTRISATSSTQPAAASGSSGVGAVASMMTTTTTDAQADPTTTPTIGQGPGEAGLSPVKPSPVASSYRDRELERRAVFGHGGAPGGAA